MLAVEIVPVEYDHLVFVAEHMRQADRDELAAGCGLDPLEALEISVDHSNMCFTALNAFGLPVCIFGVTHSFENRQIAIPWMLGTDDTKRVAKSMTVVAKRLFREVCVSRPRLVNYVDARNRNAIRWLQSMGFTLDEPAPHGVLGLPFHRFEMTCHV